MGQIKSVSPKNLLVHSGAFLCNLVQAAQGVAMSSIENDEMRRFTISLEASAHDEFKQIAASHRPPLSLQYVVRYALLRFLDENRDQQLKLGIE